MTDQTSQFFAILTAVGEAKQANANALGVPWSFAQMGVGDANQTDPIPSRTQTKLINEKRRAPLNQVKVDPSNPNIIIAEQVIPPDVGGWWIREIGLYDAADDLVAVANCAPSFKPLLSQGTGKTQVVRLNIIVSSTTNVQLKIDPAVVLATRDYVDTLVLSVLPPNKQPGTYTQVTIDKRGIVLHGYTPTTLAGYGITDALSLSGGSVSGSIKLREASSLNIEAGNTSSWAGGVHLLEHSGPGKIIGGFGGVGSHDTLNGLYMCFGSSPWFTGYGVRVNSEGTAINGPLTASGALLTDLRWSAVTGTPNSLAAYGVPMASQSEAEAGADTNKPMSSLRVFQAIAAKVVQATGSLAGIARIASQIQVDGGADDTTIVTPKKLRWGFSINKADQGYILFPSWLGGLIIQWGTTGSIAAGAGMTVTYPLAFPTVNAMTLVSNSFSVGTTTSTSSLGVKYVSLTQFAIYAVGSLGQPNAPWIAIGW